MEVQRVEIEWIDSAIERGQHTREEILQMAPISMKTCGFLSAESGSCLYVAHDFCGEGVFREIAIIPIECVRKVKYLVDMDD